MSKELKSTQVCYGEDVLMMRVDDCLIFGNKDALQKLVKKLEERTAKVEDVQIEWGDDEYINDRMGNMYHYGNCGNCGETVSHNQKYCHECGIRLEWE